MTKTQERINYVMTETKLSSIVDMLQVKKKSILVQRPEADIEQMVKMWERKHY